MDNLNHASCQQIHANKRAKQRLGIDINRHETHRLIVNNCLRFYKPIISNRQWAKIPEYGKNVWCLYDHKTNRIVTFLNETPVEVLKSILKHKKSSNDKS